MEDFFKDGFAYFYVPVLLWIIGVSIVVIILMRRFTFGKWTVENPNPYALESFGMPRGVMRGILAMSLLFLVMLLEVVTLRKPEFEKNIDQLLVAFQMMLAFYFGSKVMHHITKADERKSNEMASALSSSQPLETPAPFADEEAKG